jgi:hypothetical protein
MLADHESEAGILRLDPENLDDDAVATIVEAFRRCARPAGGSDVQTSS